ncbi:hypothetical protein AB0B45_26980 [Nonomuraea sp. NPDC049152]|uniref:hypothetical protein n=1 Tax=Nonomuraea sp. NPDC049152 TaxID=3154350 RepID=UPI0033C2DC65
MAECRKARDALLEHAGGAVLDLGRLRTTLPVVDVMGPATPAYLESGDFTAVHAGAEVEGLRADHQDVRALLAAVEEPEADESGLEGITSAAFVVRRGQDVIAAAGYRPWLGFRVLGAQISVRLSR